MKQQVNFSLQQANNNIIYTIKTFYVKMTMKRKHIIKKKKKPRN